MRGMIVMVDEEAAPLRIDPEEAAGARLRIRLDWRTFVYLVLAIVGALAVIAVFRGTETMLTRIGVGLVIALALDPLTNAVRHRFGIRRGVAVAIVASFVFGLAVLLVVVLAPRAVAEARNFSEQLPETIERVRAAPARGRLPAATRTSRRGHRNGYGSCRSSSPTNGSPRASVGSSAAWRAWRS